MKNFVKYFALGICLSLPVLASAVGLPEPDIFSQCCTGCTNSANCAGCKSACDTGCPDTSANDKCKERCDLSSKC